jgi:hypothetical protein
MHSRSPRVAVLLAASALLATVGCGGGSLSDDGPIALAPDWSVPRDERFLSWGEAVAIGDERRTAFSSSKAVMPPAEITAPEGQGRRVGTRIPLEMKDVAWFVFESTTTRGGTTTMMRSWPVVGARAGQSFAVGIVEERLGPDGIPGIRIWPCPDLASRDVETAAVAVPPHAELRVAMGIERASWDSTVVPLDMRVTALADGKEIPIGSTRLDPRKPELRRWVDTAFPLDAVGGRTVRFRFSARPMLGPTTIASLPVWADAEISPTDPGS